jgi:hypothetical protein
MEARAFGIDRYLANAGDISEKIIRCGLSIYV